MAVALIQPSFAAGELAPSLYGRVDLSKFHVGCATMRNMFVNYRGGAMSRPGTCFVGACKQPGNGPPPRLIGFQFNVEQGYVLEFGDNYLRFMFDGGYIVEAPINIASITNANPAVVTLQGSNTFSNGDWFFFSGVTGMPQVNSETYIVANATATTFTLVDIFGNAVNSTNFGTATPNTGTVERIYTIATPYSAVDLPLLKFSQSADVMSLTHPNYPPYDLERFGTTNWQLVLTDFSEKIAPPSSCTATATVTTGSSATDFQYVVTSVDSSGDESIASPIGDCANSVDIAAQAGSINVAWSAVSGAAYYRIYKAPPAYNSTVPVGSLFGLAGTAFGTSFVDSNITQDMTQVPPTHENPFAPGAVTAVNVTLTGSGYSQSSTTASITSSAGSGAVITPIVSSGGVVAFIVVNGGQNYAATDTVVISGAGTGAHAALVVGPSTGTYPGVVGYFQERRAYAGSLNDPVTYWLSKPGAFTNFDSSVPTVADDSITGTPWSLQVNGIQFMAGMPSGLVLFTGGGEWLLSGGGGVGLSQQAITPSNQIITPQGYHGCAQLCPPIPIDYDILFVQAKGAAVRVLQYNYWVSIYMSSEITTLSNHLFDGHYLREWAYAEEPNKQVFACREDGTLLSLTYFKEQDVYAWSRYDTQTD